MNQIEIIEIRTQLNSIKNLETELQKLLKDIRKESEDIKVKIYRRIKLESDFIILIMNEVRHSINGESQLGDRLSEALGDFGMVNYSKWYELEPETSASKNKR
jgi:hypothetical protein